MAYYLPLSILFEIILPVFAIIFAEKGEFGRWIGICIWPLEITILVLPLWFVTDASGSLGTATVAFPTDVQGPIIFAIFLFEIWALVDLWYFRQGIAAEKLTL